MAQALKSKDLHSKENWMFSGTKLIEENFLRREPTDKTDEVNNLNRWGKDLLMFLVYVINTWEPNVGAFHPERIMLPDFCSVVLSVSSKLIKNE